MEGYHHIMVEKMKKHKKKVIILIIVLGLIVSIFAMWANANKKKQEMMQAMNQTETASIEKRTLMSTISATGSIISSESKEISVSLSNVEVENVNVAIGDMVNAGDILCTFDSTDIEESLVEAKATLNVTTTKTQMDISSSERSLAEAVESSSIEEARINDDVADALTDYQEALNDLEDAEDDLKDAEDDTDNYKDKLNSLKNQKNSLEKEQNAYITNFDNARNNIISLVEALTISAVQNANENSDVENSEKRDQENEIEVLSIDTESIIEKVNALEITGEIPSDSSGLSDELAGNNEVTGYLQAMQTAQTSYNEKAANIASLTSEIASVQQKYETAKKTEDSLESAYEQASSAADSKYDSYEQKVRSQEDTVRNNASTIANKTDSVTTSKLNATTSGTSDKNQIEQYEEQLENCTVTSPISGIITALNIEAGDNYSGTAIATIEDISSYKITTEIDEYDIVDVEKGQKVVIKTNGTGDMELDGTVETVAPRATSATGNSSDVTYTVTITVDTPCEDLKLDMTAKLSIILESKENVLTVPYNAVQEDEAGNYYIEVINKEQNPENTTDKASNETPQEETKRSDDNMQASKMPGGNMPQMPGNMPNGRPDTDATKNNLQTTRIFITKGIESDYYIEVISDEVTEGMQVVIPQSEDTQSIQNMMMRHGPMGGF